MGCMEFDKKCTDSKVKLIRSERILLKVCLITMVWAIVFWGVALSGWLPGSQRAADRLLDVVLTIMSVVGLSEILIRTHRYGSEDR